MVSIFCIIYIGKDIYEMLSVTSVHRFIFKSIQNAVDRGGQCSGELELSEQEGRGLVTERLGV